MSSGTTISDGLRCIARGPRGSGRLFSPDFPGIQIALGDGLRIPQVSCDPLHREISASSDKLTQRLTNKMKEISRTQEQLTRDVDARINSARAHSEDIARALDETIERDLKWLKVEVIRLEIKVREAHDEPKNTILRDYLTLFELALEGVERISPDQEPLTGPAE